MSFILFNVATTLDGSLRLFIETKPRCYSITPKITDRIQNVNHKHSYKQINVLLSSLQNFSIKKPIKENRDYGLSSIYPKKLNYKTKAVNDKTSALRVQWPCWRIIGNWRNWAVPSVAVGKSGCRWINYRFTNSSLWPLVDKLQGPSLSLFRVQSASCLLCWLSDHSGDKTVFI